MENLVIDTLPNGMINVPAGMLAAVGIDPDTAARLIHDAKLQQLRIERDRRLQATDKTQLPDTPYTDAQRKAWQTYRQALRNLPESVADLDKVEWPIAPA